MPQRILVLGGDGMLGHQLVRALSETQDVFATVRRDLSDPGVFGAAQILSGLDLSFEEAQVRALEWAQPDVVINAVGIVKQRSASDDMLQSLKVNSVLPHSLAALCRKSGVRLLHISTDCVFDGQRGGYTEADLPNATDIYGRTKLLGEVADEGCLTLRTSIIGLELRRKASLIEWYLRQTGQISGYRNAIFSGLTTKELSRLIGRVIVELPDLHGVWHVATQPISKFDLLAQLTRELDRKIEIVEDDSVRIDRSLDASRFNGMTGYNPPTWTDLIHELATDIRTVYGTV